MENTWNGTYDDQEYNFVREYGRVADQASGQEFLAVFHFGYAQAYRGEAQVNVVIALGRR
jgi:hypothetical protein